MRDDLNSSICPGLAFRNIRPRVKLGERIPSAMAAPATNLAKLT